MGRLIILICLVVSSLLCLSTATPQMAPEVKKISILDLFQEDPSLKAELEAKLKTKSLKPSIAPKLSKPPVAKPTASADNKVPQPSRTKATTPRASKAPVTITTTTVTPQAAPQRGIPRRISPHRLPSRRKTPKLASATTTTTTETAASDIEPPQLPEELVAQLSSADEASDPSDAAEEEVTTKNPLARFALLPRRRPSRIRVSGKPKAPGQGIARPSKTNTAATTTTTTELNPTVAGNTGISRPRNGRFGGSRLRPGAGNRRTESAAPASSAAAVTSTVPATPGRIQLPERRSRFTNARVPPRATHSVDTTVAVTQPENSSPDAVPAVEDQTSVVSRRRNGRRFPSLTRRTS